MKRWLTAVLLVLALPLAAATRFEDLSYEEKLGQTLVVFVDIDSASLVRPAIEQGKVGGVLIQWGNYSLKQTQELIEKLQKWAAKSPHQIPLLIAIDYEGGTVYTPITLGFDYLPTNMMLSAAQDEESAATIAYLAGLELRRAGIHINFSPVLDVNSNPNNPIIGVRSFGSDPQNVTKMGLALMNGFKAAGVISVVKHFPGHGDTSADSHYQVPVVKASADELQKIHLVPFAEAVRQGRRAVCHVALDTGMGRAGILWQEAPDVLRAAATLPGLDIEGILTHFPLAYQSGSAFTQEQLRRFRWVLDAAAALGLRFRWVHAANSDAINNAPEACRAPFNLVRSGINLHGAFDAAGALRVPLKPVLTLTARLAQIRTLPAGTPLGYGHTYRTPRAMRVGTVAAGYADGLPLALSNRGAVLIRGAAAPILGRLSMDYLTVNLDDIPSAVPGDTVTLLGRDGDLEIPVQDWANLKGTHAYDIICSIGSRVARVYA